VTRGRAAQVVIAGLAVAVIASACGSSSRQAANTQAGPSPCSGSAQPAGRWRVLVVVLENHSYAQVAGSSPYLNQLAHDCALATRYSAVSHPSLPNYLALTSGTTSGITSDCTDCTTSARSIFEQLGGGWRSYLESMPGAGYGGSSSGDYAKKHNPAAYYPAVAAGYARQAVPLGQPDSGALASDLRQNSLKAFSLIVPNLCHDEHDCTVDEGDRWLSTWIPLILGSPAYADGHTALFITYDEGAGFDNRVYTVAVAPSIRPGTILRAPYDHYSLLRTVQELLGVPCVAHACDPSTASMLPGLRLRSPGHR
jgi:phosphatidylinositol-3-phosphatase